MSLDNMKNNSKSKGKILLFSYAFPPMQVQMTPTVVKSMAAIAQQGYDIDVLCADSFCPVLPLDNSLSLYVNNVFSRVHRLNPPKSIYQQWNVLLKVPDLMASLHNSAYEYLMDLNLNDYDAIMTWSPFHSINPVMVRVKKKRKNILWLAQFCDPWAHNPLEIRKLNKWWNLWHEPKTLEHADFIIHSSRYSLDFMLRNHSSEIRNKTSVLPHIFDEALYPQRPKVKNQKIILRYVGVLYGRRSPEPIFKALFQLLQRRKELADRLQVELIGGVSPEFLNSSVVHSLPQGLITHIPNVNYINSLELMYDADILLLIEADVRQNLFLASKVADYMGANTPIVGIVPPGASEDVLRELGCGYARPTDINKITTLLESAIDHVINPSSFSWCNHDYRQAINGKKISGQYINIIENLK